MAVDYLGVSIGGVEIRRGAYGGDSSVSDSDRGVPQDAGVAHLGASARACGTGAGDDLCRVNEKKVVQWLGIRI
jgi:hypothetical protein